MDGNVSNLTNRCPARRASANTASTSCLPNPVARQAGRTYNRFISQNPNSNGRIATHPIGSWPAKASNNTPPGAAYSPGNEASSRSKFW